MIPQVRVIGIKLGVRMFDDLGIVGGPDRSGDRRAQAREREGACVVLLLGQKIGDRRLEIDLRSRSRFERLTDPKLRPRSFRRHEITPEVVTRRGGVWA